MLRATSKLAPPVLLEKGVVPFLVPWSRVRQRHPARAASAQSIDPSHDVTVTAHRNGVTGRGSGSGLYTRLNSAKMQHPLLQFHYRLPTPLTFFTQQNNTSSLFEYINGCICKVQLYERTGDLVEILNRNETCLENK